MTNHHTHFEVLKKVRQTIQELGGIVPENMPHAEDEKKVQRKLDNDSKKILKGNKKKNKHETLDNTTHRMV